MEPTLTNAQTVIALSFRWFLTGYSAKFKYEQKTAYAVNLYYCVFQLFFSKTADKQIKLIFFYTKG